MTNITDVKIPLQLGEGKIFYDEKLLVAFKKCVNLGHRALFIPEIIDIGLSQGKESFIKDDYYTSPSIRVTGTSKAGKDIVVIGHVPNYFSNPENIEKTIALGLIEGAGIYPQKEFETLLDMEDNTNVFVVDYKKLRKYQSEDIKISKAITRPIVTAFIGGRERAEKYLESYEKILEREILWHSDDEYYDKSRNLHMPFPDDRHDKPYGRILSINYEQGCLSGDLFLINEYGRFIGVRPHSTLSASKSPLENLLSKGVTSKAI